MKVLIADDDPTLRMLMRSLLQRNLRYEVIEAADGMKALELLQAGVAPDLCILDVWMPRLGGIDLLARLRATPALAQQKVMLCSMENDRSTVLCAAGMGIVGYVLKPFDAKHFLELVKGACDRSTPGQKLPELESQTEVLDRLGCDRESYVELLRVFTRDVQALLNTLHMPLVPSGRRELDVRLKALHGAGKSVGALALLGALTRVEHGVGSDDVSTFNSAVDNLQVEYERLLSACDSLADRHATESILRRGEGRLNLANGASCRA